jgi:hypothetical protein
MLMKMAIDGTTNDKAKEIFDLFCDVQILLRLIAIPPLLQSICNLIEFN